MTKKRSAKVVDPQPRLVNSEEAIKAEIVEHGLGNSVRDRKKALDLAAQKRLGEIADEIKAAAAEVVLDVLKFAEVDPNQQGPSEEMVREYGEEVAHKRFRQMEAGLLPTKDSPVGVRVAMNIHAAAMRAESESQTPKLNVHVATLNVVPAQYPVLKVDR